MSSKNTEKNSYVTPGVFVREIDLADYVPVITPSMQALLGVRKRATYCSALALNIETLVSRGEIKNVEVEKVAESYCIRCRWYLMSALQGNCENLEMDIL